MICFRILMTSAAVFVALLAVRLVLTVFVVLPQWLDDAFWFVFIAIIAVFGFAFAGGLIVLAWGLL